MQWATSDHRAHWTHFFWTSLFIWNVAKKEVATNTSQKKTTHHPSLQITSDTAYFSRPNWPWCPLCRPLRLEPWVWLLGPAARRRRVGPSAAFHFRPGKNKITKTEKTRDKWKNMVSFCYKTHTISYVNTQTYFFKWGEQIHRFWSRAVVIRTLLLWPREILGEFPCISIAFPLYPLIVGPSSSPMFHRNPPQHRQQNSPSEQLFAQGIGSRVPFLGLCHSKWLAGNRLLEVKLEKNSYDFSSCHANFTYLYISYIPLRSVRDTFSIHVLISVLLSSQNLHHWANSTDSSGDMKMWEPGFMKFMIILCHYNITKTKTWYTNWFWWVCFSAYLFEIGKVDSRWLKNLWSNGFLCNKIHSKTPGTKGTGLPLTSTSLSSAWRM